METISCLSLKVILPVNITWEILTGNITIYFSWRVYNNVYYRMIRSFLAIWLANCKQILVVFSRRVPISDIGTQCQYQMTDFFPMWSDKLDLVSTTPFPCSAMLCECGILSQKVWIHSVHKISPLFWFIRIMKLFN